MAKSCVGILAGYARIPTIHFQTFIRQPAGQPAGDVSDSVVLLPIGIGILEVKEVVPVLLVAGIQNAFDPKVEPIGARRDAPEKHAAGISLRMVV